ncbi:alpha/beta hydrolase [Dyadobacter luticola]|uniref:Alpha/beta hydrolase n=1 Tax=Dyadobacter luticola TaxID=1979387 RepID=A0A5R9KTQ3_9BACT|nr:alpha/beta hydrolase [Dyadobacter luticola]TLU99547.1 alpha/beta hydrolase [Dyadobacter luticola]
MLVLLLVATAIRVQAQTKQDTIPAVLVYKKIDTLSLKIHVFKPAGFDAAKKYPAIIFFFGGGWINGNIRQFQKQALYLASRGMVTILTDYRVKSRHQTTPFEAVADGKSAVRYVRAHAGELNIDSNRIAAAGGSAGGHVAAATDLTKLDEPSEDAKISSRPNALILFNPVFNNGPGEYGHDRIGDRYSDISPYHNITKGAAPTLVMLGTSDKLVSVKTAEAYKTKMTESGNRCDLILYPNEPHGFFNRGESFTKTLRETDVFLKSLGYVAGEPTL